MRASSVSAIMASLLFFGLGPDTTTLGAEGEGPPTTLGLVRAWAAHVAVDQQQGELAHVTQHISSRSFTVYRVKDQGREVDFSTTAYDVPGDSPDGLGARHRAENLALHLRERGGSPEIVELQVPYATLYAQTNTGFLQALDAHTGRVLWTAQIGRKFYPTVAPAASDDRVAAVSGTSLVILEAATARAMVQRPTAGVPTGDLAIDDQMIYMPTLGGKLEAYKLSDESYATPWRYASVGRTVTPPLLALGNVLWTSDAGYLYAADAVQSRLLLEVEVGEPIVGGPVALGSNMFVVTTQTGSVYAYERERGRLIWGQSVGDSVDYPAICNEAVYVVARRGGMSALEGGTGRLLWHAAGVHRTLAVTRTRVYGFTQDQHLVAINRQSGLIEASAPARGLDFPLPNSQSDRIFLASKRGSLACFHEAGATWPLVYLPRLEAAETPTESPRPVEPGSSSSGVGPAADGAAADTGDGRTDEAAEPAGGAGAPTDVPAAEEDAGDPFESDAGADPFGEDGAGSSP